MLQPVTLEGNYFAAGGKRFIPIGVNWVPAREAMQWPYEWNPESIEADFSKMAEMGINFLRFDLVWQWFEPRPGQYNEEAFRQFDFFIELAHRYGIYLNPNFFIGGQVGDAYWDVPWRHNRHPHGDPDMMRYQILHVEEIAKRYRGEPAIIAWDLTDEPPFWIVTNSTTDAMAANWTQALCQSLREFDPEHLIICGTAAQEIGRGPFRADQIVRWVDFLSVHPYPIYEEFLYLEPLLSTRLTYAAGFETKLSAGAGKPVLMQEFGATSAMYSPERQAQYYNTFMYSALAAGNQGFITWCATDADPTIQYNRAPYKRNPHETQFGITDYQRNERPHGREMRRMRQVVDQMSLDGIEPDLPNAGILVPHEWAYGPDYSQYGFPADRLYQYTPENILNYSTDENGNRQIMQSWLSTFILCRQASIQTGFPREYDDWSGLKLLMAPAPLTNSRGYHLYVPFWRRVKPVVKTGATIYASLSALSALSIPEDSLDLFGASIEDRAYWSPEIQLTFQEDFFGIAKGENFSFQAPCGLEYTGCLLKPEGAQVVALDQDGNPAILTHKLENGISILCAYPIEMYLGVIPNAFENDTRYWKLYRAIKAIAGIHDTYEADRPGVEVGVLTGKDRDYVILVNHTHEYQEGRLKVSNNLHQVLEIQPEHKSPVDFESSSFFYLLRPFHGAVYEFLKK